MSVRKGNNRTTIGNNRTTHHIQKGNTNLDHVCHDTSMKEKVIVIDEEEDDIIIQVTDNDEVPIEDFLLHHEGMTEMSAVQQAVGCQSPSLVYRV